MQHAQQIARALHEANELQAFVTSFAFLEDSPAARLAQALPTQFADRLLRQLRRRAVVEVPPALVQTHPFWELLRTGLSQLGANPRLVDQAWDLMAHRFDAVVAERHVPKAKVIHAFEYTALASFQRAATEGVTRVLHLPSLDSKQFEAVRQREQHMWPGLQEPHEAYFARKFEARYERRLREIELANLIVANSSLTRQSHINAGADPHKFVVVPLGGPTPVEHLSTKQTAAAHAPLTVLWAGSFSLGKGAHYCLEAWRRLAAGRHARALVFGAMGVPEGMLARLPEGIELQGSVPQGQLFTAYDAADVLVFPTLSDGFGMVVTEALSRGLPVITTNQAGAADLIEHGKNGFIIPAADPQALEAALRWCLDERAKLAGMRQAALDTARRNQWGDYRTTFTAAMAQQRACKGQHTQRMGGST
jgi:glycosyltransferase involved in cell wall biosynthesis